LGSPRNIAFCQKYHPLIVKVSKKKPGIYYAPDPIDSIHSTHSLNARELVNGSLNNNIALCQSNTVLRSVILPVNNPSSVLPFGLMRLKTSQLLPPSAPQDWQSSEQQTKTPGDDNPRPPTASTEHKCVPVILRNTS
jgi:hypothetical protein